MEYLCLSVHPSTREIWITYIQVYMPHESSEDSSHQPDGPKGSTRYPLDPPGPPPPIDPLEFLNSSLGLIRLLRSPEPHYKSSEDPSNVAVKSPLSLRPPSPLAPWDPVGQPLDPLGPWYFLGLPPKKFPLV